MNLLIVLNALLLEHNTTAVGKKLNMSQSNVSRSLKELRVIFEDELLIKGKFSSEMVLTSKAKSLLLPVKKLIEDTKKIFTSEKFDPNTNEKHFRIGIYDTGASISFTASGVFTPLITELLNEFPTISLSIVDMGKQMRLEDFEDFNLDFCIGTPPSSPHALKSRTLQEKTRFVCVSSKNHSALKKSKLTIDILEKYPHLILTYGPSANLEENTNGLYKQILSKSKIKNIRYFEIQSIFTSILVMKESDALCIMPESVAKIFEKNGNIIINQLPFTVLTQPIMLYWQIEYDNDPSYGWFKEKLLDAIKCVKTKNKPYSVLFE